MLNPLYTCEPRNVRFSALIYEGIVRPTGQAILDGLSVLANSSGSFLDALWFDLRCGGQTGRNSRSNARASLL